MLEAAERAFLRLVKMKACSVAVSCSAAPANFWEFPVQMSSCQSSGKGAAGQSMAPFKDITDIPHSPRLPFKDDK